ncbi:MAG: hypothetical protein WCJ33_07160 [Pseudomonadota bacterium]
MNSQAPRRKTIDGLIKIICSLLILPSTLFLLVGTLLFTSQGAKEGLEINRSVLWIIPIWFGMLSVWWTIFNYDKMTIKQIPRYIWAFVLCGFLSLTSPFYLLIGSLFQSGSEYFLYSLVSFLLCGGLPAIVGISLLGVMKFREKQIRFIGINNEDNSRHETDS